MAFSRLEFVKRFGLAVGGLAVGGPKALAELSPSPSPAPLAPLAASPVDFLGDTALVASGGLCAPITPYYKLRVVDALPSFGADRARITFIRD